MKQTRMKRLAGALALVLAGTAMSGCGAAAHGSATSGASPIKIQVYPGTIWSVPIYAAQEQGFFKKEGLDATLVPEDTGPAAIAALASRSVDAISVSPEVIMGAIAKGLKAKVIAGTMANPWMILVGKNVTVPNGSYPEVLKALKGTTVGVPAIPSAGQAMLFASLSSVGLKESDVKSIAVGIGPSALAALQTGQIQALIIQQPISEEAVQKSGAKVLADPRQGQIPSSLTGPYLGEWVSSSVAEQHPATVQKLRAALKQADDWLADPNNATQVSSLLKKQYNVPGLNYDDMAKQDKPLWLSDYSQGTLNTWMNYDVKYGFLDNSIPTQDLVWSGR